MASLIGSQNDDALSLMFQIFDIDEDGYLEIEDMARILLTQNQIAVITTGSHESTTVVYTKEQCMKKARRMVEHHDSSEFSDGKISFDEFLVMMMKRDTKDMMIEHMSAPSISVIDLIKNQSTSTMFVPGQTNLSTPSDYTPTQ
eukprot:29426_1